MGLVGSTGSSCLVVSVTTVTCGCPASIGVRVRWKDGGNPSSTTSG
jgi:hypothetical protein